MTAPATGRTAPQREDDADERLGRTRVNVPVELGTPTGRTGGVARNVGLGGLFVATPQPLPVGDRVTVQVSDPDGGGVDQIGAEVRWTRAADGGERRPAGMGLSFIEPLLEVAVFVRVVLKAHARPRG
ncbi:MAG TPA: PilZ domain-containing protein [Polyangia bacterium]|nr:PilZ domain-containing protein [Polyangia bacterium]